MSYHIGIGYIGSSEIKTTATPNTEIIPVNPKTNKNYNCYKFSIMNPNQPMTVKINNSSPIFIDKGMGFNTDRYDSPIWSFVILEKNVDYFFIGAYY